MDLKKLTQGDSIIGVSGIVLFLVSFFSWLGYSVSGIRSLPGVPLSDSASAWHFTLTVLAVLFGLALVVYVFLKAAGVEIPSKFGSVTLAQIVLGIATVAFLFVLIKLIAGPNIDTGSFGTVTISKTRKVGIFIGLLATIGLVAGAFLNLQGELSSSPPPA